MNKFSSVYKTELKRNLKKKSIIVIFVVFCLLTIILIASMNFASTELGSGVQTKFETPEDAKLYYENILASGTLNDKFLNSNQIKQVDRQIEAYTYMIEKNISMSDAVLFTGDSFGGFSSFDINLMVEDLFLMCAVIIVIILTSGSIIGELKDGTMRQTLMRPIDRTKLLFAKEIAILTVAIIVYLLAMVLFSLINSFAFNQPTTDYIISIFGGFAKVNHIAILFVKILCGFLFMFGIQQLTVFIGQISSSKNLALALPLIIVLIGESVIALLGYIGYGIVSFSNNLNWGQFLAPSGSDYKFVSFYSASILTIVYFISLVLLNKTIFEKTDVN